MNEKKLGKITSVRVGMGGYQDAMFGVWFNLGGEDWGCGDGKGPWATWHEGCKWTPTDQSKFFSEVMYYIRDLCVEAKVRDVAKLKGVPIEAVFENNTLKSWRILKEVL